MWAAKTTRTELIPYEFILGNYKPLSLLLVLLEISFASRTPVAIFHIIFFLHTDELYFLTIIIANKQLSLLEDTLVKVVPDAFSMG